MHAARDVRCIFNSRKQRKKMMIINNREYYCWVVLKVMIIMLVVIELQGMWRCESCLEVERNALLELKSAINYPNPTSLSSWWIDDRDCCNWNRVECDPTTGRVILLDLFRIRDRNSGEWYLNVSLFLPFQQLQALSLENNQIVGYIKNEGFERLSTFRNLEYLDLSYNLFNNSIISSFDVLLSLKYLYLSYNRLKGTLHVEELAALSNLERLDLSGNKIDEFVAFKGFERLSTFHNLEYLDLSNNLFNNSIISSLKHLDLSYNRLKGTLHVEELAALSNLERLYLSGNEIDEFVAFKDARGPPRNLSTLYLEGITIEGRSRLLESLGAFPYLKTLDLGWSNFKGKIIDEGHCNLSNVEELYLDGSSLDHNSLQSFGAAMSSLKLLSLSEMNGLVPSPDWPSFKNLEQLYLNDSTVEANILYSIGMITTLRTLNLTWGMGPISSRGWSNLKNLEHLDMNFLIVDSSFVHSIEMMTSLKTLSLSGCQIIETIPASAITLDFSRLNQLQELHMTFNDLGGNLSFCLSNLTSLQILKISSHHFILKSDLCQLENLQELDISGNDFTGSLPMCLSNLTSLKRLDLSSNDFKEDINSSPIVSLTSLQYIELSDNQFQIPISLHPFLNHSKLTYFSAKNNKIYGETEDHTSAPKFQLDTLSLSNGNVAEIPKFLYHQHNLEYISLSHLNMKGEFPHWLLENNTGLQSLYLSNNSLSGHLRLPTHSHLNFYNFDISNNCFYSPIPSEIGAYLPRVQYLNMSRNGFNGSIPSSFGKMSLLDTLDLSNNRLSGIIPEHLSTGCGYLTKLILSNNSLEGPIFSEKVNLQNLWFLFLDGNKFNGSIPYSLSYNTQLITLDLSGNHLSGKIPTWIRNMSNLVILDLSDNGFSGSFPSEFFSSQLQLEEVHLSKNKMQGSLENAFVYNDSKITVSVLDLSHNNFSGRIPEWIGRFSQLSYLLLGHNNFEGPIPLQLCKLGRLSLIDLSNNNLSGHIPPCLRATSDWYREHETDPTIFAPGPSSPQPQQSVEFATKNASYFYEARTLPYFSGIDLSCNNLLGQIPLDFGRLFTIKVLNLSHNSLTGPIPSTISNLSQIESLDLSYNNLNGEIPPQLTQLNYLEVFSVAHNNLSGMTPQRVAQFGTFDEGSYDGNPLLCGLPLPKSCHPTPPPTMPTTSSEDEKEEEGFIDMEVFYVSFWVSYIIVLLAIAAVLYINPYWRRAWFYFIEFNLTRSYYFLLDNIPFLSKFGLS